MTALTLLILLLNGAALCAFGSEPSSKAGCSVSKARVAVINHATFHNEVLFGLLHNLVPLFAEVHLYLDQKVADHNYLGARDLFLQYPTAKIHVIGRDDYNETMDVAICMSPEYGTWVNKRVVKALQVQWVLAFIHNGDTHQLAHVMDIHPNTTLVTIAPHVAKYVGREINRNVSWMLASGPFRPRTSCEGDSSSSTPSTASFSHRSLVTHDSDERNHPCFKMFAVQGNVKPGRRDYGRLWRQLSNDSRQEAREIGVMVVGANPSDEMLQATSNSLSRISFHSNLPFMDFYEILYRARAMLMLLASPNYLTVKATATIITALTTRVPVLMLQSDAEVYTMMKGVVGNT